MTREPDPRFLQANERTFLAWMRTALAIGAAGMAIAGLAPDTEPVWVRGAISVALATLAVTLMMWAVRRFRAADSALRHGTPLPQLHGAPVIAFALALLVVASVVALLVATHS